MRELIEGFKEMDYTCEKIKEVNEKIRDIIGFFEDEEESDNSEVKDLVKKKDFLFDRLNFYRKKANGTMGGFEYKTLECDYFVNKFNDTQNALDYINGKLENYSIVSGTRGLMTGLGYSSKVESYSTFNLLYAQYKIHQVFGVESVLI